MKLAGRTIAGLLPVLLASSLLSTAQEPTPARLYACVEREDAYLARTGITDRRGIDNPTSGGMVLTSARPVTGNPMFDVSGDYLVSNRKAESEIAAAVGTRLEVIGFISSLRVRYAADGRALPRRMSVTEWHAAGACSPVP